MRFSILVSSVAVAAMLAAFAAPARADQCDKLTYLTFSTPVALPGVTLPAGTYRFTHPECGVSDRVLRVSSEDGLEVYATLLTVPEDRVTSDNQPDVIFAEGTTGAPKAVKAWFYPGERTGDELIYPKERSTIRG